MRDSTTLKGGSQDSPTRSLHPSYFGDTTAPKAGAPKEGEETELTNKEKVQAYQGMADQINSQIGQLRGQPGSEEKIKGLQDDLVKVYQRGAEVPPGEGTAIPATKAPVGAKVTDPLQKGLINLFRSRSYNSADPVKQRQVRENVYDQILKPYYDKQGKQAPDRNYFVNRIAPDQTPDWAQTGKTGAAHLSVETLKMMRNSWNAMLWTASHYNGDGMGQGLSWEDAKKNPVSQYFSKLQGEGESYIGSHYAEDLRSNIVNYAGEQIPTIVAWELAAAPLGKLVELAPKNYLRFALNRVKDYAIGYTTGKAQDLTDDDAHAQGWSAVKWNTAFWFLGRMGAWLGPKKTLEQLAKDAEKLQDEQKLLKGGQKQLGPPKPPIITPPPTIPAERQLPPTVSREMTVRPEGRGPAGTVITPPPTEVIPPQAQLKSGVEGAKRPLDFISAANAKLLNEMTQLVSNGKFRQFTMAPDSVRTQALKEAGYILGETMRNPGVRTPEIVEANAKANIEKQAAQSPGFKTIIDTAAKATGEDPAKVIAAHVQRMSQAETSWAKINELIKGLGPGGASKNEATIMNEVRNIVRSELKLPDKRLQTVFAWARRADLPEQVQGVVKQEMKNMFGNDPKKWNMMAKNLDDHIDMLIKNKKIPPMDFRGVFSSTNLEGNPTKWQDVLSDENKEMLRKAKEMKKKWGPGAADIDDPAFKEDPKDIDRRVVQHIERTDAERERIRAASQPVRDTNILQQVQREHPEWSLSQQLMEAARRANPKGK